MWRLCALVIVSSTLSASGCGRLCVGTTPVEQSNCIQEVTAMMSYPATLGIPTALVNGYGETPLLDGQFQIGFQTGSMSLLVTSWFPRGATTYTLPSADVIVDAERRGPTPDASVFLQVVSGAITVATANEDVLDASGSLTLADDQGQTYTVSSLAVHIACAYDETVCR